DMGEMGIPEEKRVEAVYRLTPKGRLIASRLIKWAKANNPEILKSVQDIVAKYGEMTTDQLLRYTYNKYPEYAANSKVRDKYIDPDFE
ncbi:MAG: hypothetical protein HY548_07365, partial [Elusimicrobia bacterium]|nr:hypothetical protein [Elusimicrobiota bacterium]